MDLNGAIQKHSEWKIKLRIAINRKESMDEATISKDNCCELGKWLHGDGKIKFSKLASYGECINKHALFHVEAGKVAAHINAKNYLAAAKMLEDDTSYTDASKKVSVAIMGLKKEAAL